MIFLANQKNNSCRDLANKSNMFCLYTILMVLASLVSILVLLHLDTAATEYIGALQR